MADGFRLQVERWGGNYDLTLGHDTSGIYLLVRVPSVGHWVEYPLDPKGAADLAAALLRVAQNAGEGTDS